ncbi:MAG: hypothetical protein N3D10_00435 [Candidatus Micrarchaeota archaeon]|nr:hypothetical protein [Candidatus Micrarchaeota archaeon]
MNQILVPGQNLIDPAYQLGLYLVAISIILAGFILGIGKALGSRKMQSWGIEELTQAIINAALLGALVSISVVLSQLADSLVGTQPAFENCSYPNFPLFIQTTLCAQDNILSIIYQSVSKLTLASYQLGSLSTLTIKFNVVDSLPLFSLRYISENFALVAKDFLSCATILETQKQFLFFIASSGFSIFLPIGLLLRMFFMTRKVGGAILAGAIGFYIFYPLFLLSLTLNEKNIENVFSSFSKEIDSLILSSSPFPQVDWNKEQEVLNLFFNSLGSNPTLASKTSSVLSLSSQFLGIIQLHSYIFVLVNISCSLIFIYQLASVLGSELNLQLFENL